MSSSKFRSPLEEPPDDGLLADATVLPEGTVTAIPTQTCRKLEEGVRTVVRAELRGFLEEFQALAGSAAPLPAVSSASVAGRVTRTSVSFRSDGSDGGGALPSVGQERSASTMAQSYDIDKRPSDRRARQTFAEKFTQDSEDVARSSQRALKSMINSSDTQPARVASSAWDKLSELHGLDEPAREGCVAELVLSKRFEFVATLVIFLNCGFMVAAANYQVEHPGSDGSYLMRSMEIFFLAFYSMEVLLKLMVHRWFFFWNEDVRWNCLDLSLVIYGYFDILLGGMNITWLRSLRLLRMAKVLRVLRIVKSFKELRLILACLVGSFLNLLWSIVMICIIVFMFSLVFVQQTGSYLADQAPEDRDADNIGEFDTVQRSMLSLYAAVTGGQDWLVFYETLQPTGDLSCAIFLFFIAFIQIALVNILTGIFVEKALKRATPDTYTQARALRKQAVKQASELKQLCEEMDTDGDKCISKSEFFNTRSKHLKDYLKLMGLDFHDIVELFNLLSGEDDKKVPVEDFVRACMRLKTVAPVDIQKLICESDIMMSHVRFMEDSLEQLHLKLNLHTDDKS